MGFLDPIRVRIHIDAYRGDERRQHRDNFPGFGRSDITLTSPPEYESDGIGALMHCRQRVLSTCNTANFCSNSHKINS